MTIITFLRSAMRININLHSSLIKSYLGLVNKEFVHNGDRNIQGLINALEMDNEKICLIFTNKTRADMESIIKDGDTVQFFPFIGGG